MTRQEKIFFRHVRQLQRWGMTRGCRRKNVNRVATKVHDLFEFRQVNRGLDLSEIKKQIV